MDYSNYSESPFSRYTDRLLGFAAGIAVGSKEPMEITGLDMVSLKTAALLRAVNDRDREGVEKGFKYYLGIMLPQDKKATEAVKEELQRRVVAHVLGESVHRLHLAAADGNLNMLSLRKELEVLLEGIKSMG